MKNIIKFKLRFLILITKPKVEFTVLKIPSTRKSDVIYEIALERTQVTENKMKKI